MLEEFYIACALPHSVEADARFHVSVFLAPTIHTSSQTTLAACPLFRNWGEVVRTRLAVELIDQSGPIPCEVLLEPVNPDLWRKLFPRDTDVVSDAVPDWNQRHWRSFAARRVHDFARDLHMSTIYASPTGKPRLGDLPIAEAAAKMLGAERPRSDRTGRILEDRPRPMPDEGRLTLRFDEVVEGRRPLEEIERDIAHRQDWLERAALELHRCRRFYERPESRQEYRDRPDPRAKLPPLPRSKSEFHERCALAGDHGELLRRLGLVLDLRVAEPGRLRQSQWLSAQVSVGGSLNACRAPRVHCRVAGDALVASAEAQDRNWADGALRLGDTQRFSVLALDADGSALKMERYLWTLPRLLRAEENGDPADGATPSLRSPGFTVVATQQAIAIRDRLKRQQNLESAFGGGTVADLHAADVTRGFRVEVWDEHARRWASLHRRLASAARDGFRRGLQRTARGGIRAGNRRARVARCIGIAHPHPRSAVRLGRVEPLGAPAGTHDRPRKRGREPVRGTRRERADACRHGSPDPVRARRCAGDAASTALWPDLRVPRLGGGSRRQLASAPARFGDDAAARRGRRRSRRARSDRAGGRGAVAGGCLAPVGRRHARANRRRHRRGDRGIASGDRRRADGARGPDGRPGGLRSPPVDARVPH